MERLIAYDKLAREDRLVRMRAREVAQLKVDQGLPPFPDLLSRDSIKERVHGIMVGELQAMEGAGRTVYDFPDAPWEFTMDMARQVWDESRHVEIYVRLLEHLDGYIGEFPETTILWRCACAEDAAARVAGVNRGLEGLACDVFNQLVHIARKLGDPIIERSVDFVLADEITHVRMGSRWLNELTRRAAAPMTAHPLAGAFSVEASSRVIRNYRYVEERMMRILGGWIALTPEVPVKLLFGRHV